MDPDVVLQQLRRLARRAGDSSYDQEEVASAMAGAFDALDGWMSDGGFPPKDWGPKPFKRPEGIPPRRDWARDHDPDAPVPGKDFP